MPSTTRRPTPAESAPGSRASAEPAPPAGPPAEPGPVEAAAPTSGQGGSALVDLVTFPVRVSQSLVRDVAVTARNPEAVAYWGGLAGLAVLGALEWPVAAAAGLGVVVAGAVRRARG
jgi:hypothetical protein